jgi:hypothetical protein
VAHRATEIPRKGRRYPPLESTRMPKLALLQFDTDPNAAERRASLADSGATIVEAEPRWPTFFDTIERERPDLIVIACGVIPEHAREAARYLGEGFNTRNIPVMLVDVRPHDLAATKQSAPSARIVDATELAAAVTAVFQ